jgi:predicted XRE-type DNA-binding protein
MRSFNGLGGTAPLFPLVADRPERFLVALPVPANAVHRQRANKLLSVWPSTVFPSSVLPIMRSSPMPTGNSLYPRKPGRLAREKKEFRQLVAELKRLASQEGYSQAQIASELGVSLMTVSHWWTGYSLMAQHETIERLKKFLSAHC